MRDEFGKAEIKAEIEAIQQAVRDYDPGPRTPKGYSYQTFTEDQIKALEAAIGIAYDDDMDDPKLAQMGEDARAAFSRIQAIGRVGTLAWVLHRFVMVLDEDPQPNEFLGVFWSESSAVAEAEKLTSDFLSVEADPTMTGVFTFHRRAPEHEMDPQPLFLLQQVPIR